jgi:hypothetical protein
MFQSNAANGKDAKEASKKADAMTEAAKDGDGSHQKAQQAHMTAAYKNENAGNGTKAKEHEKQALVHGEKANSEYRDKDYAASVSRDAEVLSTKAEKAGFGDKKDPRSGDELHQAASDAHAKASKAHDLAGNKTDAAYHAAKADKHAEAATGHEAA